MGIYLGQLPPAEIARLKAELAETLIANFCYPRFFDSRTESLRMRPVDRAKRQEVWLYLSSFDFTAWSRVDLMSPDFQHYIERLFIQFVQRNRSFFGQQGRRRMSDIRMLIGSCASTVVLGLRNHITGQKQGNPPFGSPRPVASWSTSNVSGRAEPGWDQISAATALLQQQLQELRGEIKPATSGDGRASTVGTSRRSTRSQALGSSTSGVEYDAQPQVNGRAATPPASPPHSAGGKGIPLSPAASATSSVQARKSGPLVPPSGAAGTARKSEPLVTPAEPTVTARKSEPLSAPAGSSATPLPTKPIEPGAHASPLPEKAPPASSLPIQARDLAQSAPPAAGIAANQRGMLSVGEDDIAIFEQMRHQLLIWLRVEAIRAGLDIAGQSPAQLLETLRQQARLDETRLQVVSTLLNLSNQVIKTGIVSILDYKQALMFHLMHTRR